MCGFGGGGGGLGCGGYMCVLAAPVWVLLLVWHMCGVGGWCTCAGVSVGTHVCVCVWVCVCDRREC